MHTAWRQHSKTVCGLREGTEEKRTGQKMKEGLLVGVPAEDTRVEKSELPLQHLQSAASPLPGGPYGATGNTCHCIWDSYKQSRGKERRRCPENKSPRQKLSREKEHRASKNNTRASVWCSKERLVCQGKFKIVMSHSWFML